MIKRKWSQILKREEGSGLIMALMTLMVLSVLGISLGMITVNGFRLSHINRDSTSVYYIAEAGANQAFEDIRSGVMGLYSEETDSSEFLSKVENTYLGFTKDYTDFEPQNGKIPQASVEVVEGEGENDYILRSTGTIGNATRTVEKPFGVNWVERRRTDDIKGNIPDISTTVAKNKIDFRNGVKVVGLEEGSQGSVHLDSTDPNSIDLPNNYDGYNLLVHLPPDADLDAFESKPPYITYRLREESLNWEIYYEFLDQFPTFPLPTDSININGDNINIDTGDRNMRLVVDNLDVNNLNITGKGRVDIFVKNSLKLNGSINNQGEANPRNLQIFYSGSQKVNMSTSNYNGSLFIENAELELANNAVIDGVIITGGERVSLGSIKGSSLLIAPRAIVSFGTGASHNTIEGLIVGKEIIFRNNVTIRLDNKYLEEFPLVLPGFADDEFNENGEVIDPGSILEVR